MHVSDDDLLTVKDVAEILRVPTSWVYERTRRRSTDRIPGFRIGKYWRFRFGDIKVWLEENRHVELTNA
jgi:excisionase family DNA binding protein